MTKFTLWEILLDQFELNHKMTCPHYLAKRHPAEKLVEDFTYEFYDCPGLSREEYREMLNHFQSNSDLVERISYSEAFCEEAAVQLLESFPLASAFKTREVDLSTYPGANSNSGESFELWRQDDNGNEFLVSKFSCRHEAQLLRKRLERRGHKQHYWVK